MKKALIVYSGGMDSTVLLYQERSIISGAVHFSYGSKHNQRELEFARKNCEALGIPLSEINLDFIPRLFRSALLKNSHDEIPLGHYEDPSMKKTVVPFRNGIMLSIACGIAESNQMDKILIANHKGDHAIYPDCREDFITFMRSAMISGTYNNIELSAPYTLKSKREIALIGRMIGIDFRNTYSCYQGGEIHCGECGTCVERREALEGFDNTDYKVF